MTGFGNFLYFDKKQDFSIERAISMWLRINYFPLLLSFALNVKLENYYVVPLHTAGFFVTMATCYLAKVMEYYISPSSVWSTSFRRNAVAILICFLVHIIFYETEMKSILKIFSDEYYFRFQVDKYSAVIGILSGFVWGRFKDYMNWCYGSSSIDTTTTTSTTTVTNGDNSSTTATNTICTGDDATMSPRQRQCMWYQRGGGAFLIMAWWYCFGSNADKFTYNPIHPYIFWMPVAGYLMLRNSSKYLTEVHSEALEFLGKITLETYVLQFHVFMCQEVQHIPIVIPGSGPEGDAILRFLNMLLCGTLFVALAYWARQITITTQTTFTDLLVSLMKHWRKGKSNSSGSGGGTNKDNHNSVEMNALMANQEESHYSRKQSEITIMAAAPMSDNGKDSSDEA
jgi:hypothetical protein